MVKDCQLIFGPRVCHLGRRQVLSVGDLGTLPDSPVLHVLICRADLAQGRAVRVGALVRIARIDPLLVWSPEEYPLIMRSPGGTRLLSLCQLLIDDQWFKQSPGIVSLGTHLLDDVGVRCLGGQCEK
jgi:hypothetical protein